MQSCFAMETRGSVRHISGKGQTSWNRRRGRVLTSCDVSPLVIDSLCDQAGGQNVTVACLYFDFAAQKEQSPANMLGALLKQLVAGLGELPEEMMQAYENQKNSIGGRRPRHTDIMKMLRATASTKRTFICIDALDECVPEHRIELLDSLNKILRESPGTRIFVTGRPHIRPEIARRLAGRVTSLSISTKKGDIIRYLRFRLEHDPTPDAMNGSLEAEILKKIPEDVSGMYVDIPTLGKLPEACTDEYISRFLLVRLNIDVVLQEATIHHRRQKLSAMTDGLGLGNAYGATLGRIKAQGGDKARLGISALMWISQSERLLMADELCHALSVEIGSPNLNDDNVPSIATLLACCQGLVVVEKEAATVRLIHFTLQEYLRDHPNLFGPNHSTMAETCLTYLNFQQVKTFSTSLSPSIQDTPFLEYSSVYWGVHAKRDFSDGAKLLALRLFDDYNSHISTKILVGAQGMWGVDVDKFSRFSGLHCASLFGISELVASLLKTGGCDINQMDFTGSTPLHWAARGGHEGVVKKLLGIDGVSPDEPNINGETPLHLAAWFGREEVMNILLGQGVNPDKLNTRDQTPLCLAAGNGQEGVIKILLDREGVSPEKLSESCQTALCNAAQNGHEGVMKILLGRGDFNPDKPNSEDQTPLFWAARNGLEAVVEMLLGRDVNPDKPDNMGRTPLFIASCYGHEGVVKMLLGRGVNPDKPNINGRTPLHSAAWNGKDGVVKILLARDDVNPNKLDNDGKAPLHRAAEEGHEGVVKALLGRDDVNRDELDMLDRTPLFYATENGYRGVVALLQPSESTTPVYHKGEEPLPPHRPEMRVTGVLSPYGPQQFHNTTITAVVSPLYPPDLFP